MNVIFDISLRAITIVVRAIFVFYLAKFLSISDFGLYTYLIASIAFFMYLAGADFYAYAHREMLSGRCSVAETLKAQVIFLAFSTSLVAVLSVVTSWASLSSFYLLVLPLLITGEALAAECVRFLIASGKPSPANAVNFLKSAGWMLPVWAFAQHKGTLSMEFLLGAWVLGLLVAVVCGLLWTSVKWTSLKSAQIPVHFYRQAVFLLPKILLGTLALRTLFSLDRLAIGYAFDVNILGIYGFFVALASAYLAVLDAGIISRLFPLLVAAAADNSQMAKKYCKQMELSALLSGAVALVLYSIFIDSVIAYIGKPDFLAYKQLGSLILVSYVVYAYSMGAHYVLYGRKQDIKIMAVHIFSMLPFAVMICLAAYFSLPYLIAWGILLAMIFQFVLKRYFAKQYA